MTSQTLIGLAVSDGALLKAFAEGHPRLLDVAASSEDDASNKHGHWGLGFHSHGEMLVRKGPLSALKPQAMPHYLRDVRARHAILVAEREVQAHSRRLEDCMPLRYRDWLFAATGTVSLGPGFAERVQAELPTYAFSHKRHPSHEEAVMMLIMASLERANARDTRDLTTRAIQKALTLAASSMRRLASDPDRASLLTLLHVHGHVFAFAIGRPLWIARFRGAGEAVRPGRLPRHEHLRVIVVGDRTDPDAAWELVPAGLGVEIDHGCEVGHFPA
jgi:hypothetical protein